LTARQKQSAARVLTSAILNSVFFIESRGHRSDALPETPQTATTALSMSSPESAGTRPLQVAPLSDRRPTRVVCSGNEATADAASTASGGAAQQQPRTASPQPLTPRVIEVTATRLELAIGAPLHEEAWPLSAPTARRFQLVRILKGEGVTVCVPAAVVGAAGTSLRQLVGALSAGRLGVVRRVVMQTTGAKAIACPRLRTGIDARSDEKGTTAIRVIDPGTSTGQRRLSGLVGDRPVRRAALVGMAAATVSVLSNSCRADFQR
jgi:hypothetical protein